MFLISIIPAVNHVSIGLSLTLITTVTSCAMGSMPERVADAPIALITSAEASAAGNPANLLPQSRWIQRITLPEHQIINLNKSGTLSFEVRIWEHGKRVETNTAAWTESQISCDFPASTGRALLLPLVGCGTCSRAPLRVNRARLAQSDSHRFEHFHWLSPQNAMTLHWPKGEVHRMPIGARCIPCLPETGEGGLIQFLERTLMELQIPTAIAVQASNEKIDCALNTHVNQSRYQP